jgi:hypothetical protein
MLLAATATAETSVGRASMPDLNASGRTVMNYLGLLAGISFVPLFLFFTLLSVFPSRTQRKVLYFMEVFVGYVTAFFQGQLLIAVSIGGL